MEKRWVQDNFANDLQWLDLEDVIPILQSAIKAEAAGHWQRIRLKIERDYDMTSIQLVGNRLETDLEYKQRMAEESKRENLQEANERAQYESLKKKYGDK